MPAAVRIVATGMKNIMCKGFQSEKVHNAMQPSIYSIRITVWVACMRLKVYMAIRVKKKYV